MLLVASFLLAATVIEGKVLFGDECLSHRGLWACSDCDSCTSLLDCPFEEAEYRAGYKCLNWPYFNRVSPDKSDFFLLWKRNLSGAFLRVKPVAHIGKKERSPWLSLLRPSAPALII